MKQLLPLIAFFLLSSCIPIKIAPGIADHKLMLAKKFQRKLPAAYALIFEDPKDEQEFYFFINSRYTLIEQNDQLKIPLLINNETFLLSYYEVEKSTKTINFVPILLDGLLASKGMDPWFENIESTRTGHWFLVLTVSDSNNNDCLDPTYQFHKDVLDALKTLKDDYLRTI